MAIFIPYRRSVRFMLDKYRGVSYTDNMEDVTINCRECGMECEKLQECKLITGYKASVEQKYPNFSVEISENYQITRDEDGNTDKDFDVWHVRVKLLDNSPPPKSPTQIFIERCMNVNQK